MPRGQGIEIQTDDGSIKTVVFGWGAVALGVGLAVASVVLSVWLGWSVLAVGVGLGIGLACIGAGEGVKRARQGRAAEIAAARGELPPPERPALPVSQRGVLPPPWERR